MFVAGYPRVLDQHERAATGMILKATWTRLRRLQSKRTHVTHAFNLSVEDTVIVSSHTRRKGKYTVN